MSKDDLRMKQCFVLLEPCTPKAQLALSAELRNVINERNILTSRTKKKFLSALDEINETDVETRRRLRKNQAVQEIFDSEAVYLRSLENIMNFFMKPVKEKVILTDFQYEILFGSIKNIYKVNGELLNELRENLTNVASAFSKLAPFFKIYSVYAYDFKKSLEMLEKLHHENGEFTKLLVNQESRPEVQAKLSSLLITPIQRIPRYCLLLRQVLDNTLPTDPDYCMLKDSLEKLEEVARHVNALVEERENSQRLLELHRCLKNGKNLIIQPGRKLIKEGVLTKHDNKQKEKIYLVLMSDVVMCCKIRKSNISQPNSLKCTFIYPLNRCKISQNHNTKMFEIACQDESLILYHEQGSESNEWIKILNATVNRCVNNRMTLRKGSSSRRPAGRNNFESYTDVGLSPGVSRVKKRRRTEDDDAIDEKLEDKILKLERSKRSTSCLPIRLSKRKTIHSENNHSYKERSARKSTKGKDSLYPLRRHFLDTQVTETTPNAEIVPYQPNVFIFGRENNQHRGFTFKLGNIISGISSSLKRVFERFF